MFRFDRKIFDPHLRPYVSAYWEMERIDPKPVVVEIPAVAVMHLVFEAKDLPCEISGHERIKSFEKAFAGLVRSAGKKIVFFGHTITYGITITPVGLWHLFKVKTSDLGLSLVAFDDLCKIPGPDLFSTDPDTNGAIIRWQLVREWLNDLYKRSIPTLDIGEKMAHAIFESHGQTKVLSMIEDCSSRHAQRIFKERMGITAKGYACLLRFNTVLALLASRPGISLLEAALQTGYNDASHLCHDFKKLGVQLPSEWANSPDDHTASLIGLLH